MGYLREYGSTLIDKGFNIVPIAPGTKYPKLKNWQSLDISHTLLESMVNGKHKNDGVGILNAHNPAIDIDIYDKVYVDKLINYIQSKYDVDIPIRVGNAPKSLMVFSTDTPFSKLASKTYIDSKGRENRVEILGDGQQFVAYAIHPDTKEPYAWDVDELPPSNDLPILTPAIALDIIAYFEELAEEAGLTEKGGNHPSPLAVDEFHILNNLKSKVDLDHKQIKKCLVVVPSDDYETWVKVGMALYHQYDGAHEGFLLWDAWSRTSDKYVGDILEKWGSFKESLTKEPITFASVIDMAKSLKLKTQEADDPIHQFIDNYIYVTKGDQVARLDLPPQHILCKFSEFKNATQNIKHEVLSPTKTNPVAVKSVPVWQSWLNHEDRKTAVDITYQPSENTLVSLGNTLLINTFSFPEFKESDSTDKLEPFFEHLEYLIPNETEREWFLGWMAFSIQRPNVRCKVTPLHVAKLHGTGRGWIVELLQKLLGFQNLSKTKMSVLAGEGSAGQYQDYLHQSLVVAIEEVREQTMRYGISDKIRDVLESSYLEVNLKYGGMRTIEVFCNFFLMSNHADALVLTKEDRRIQVLTGPDFIKPNAYYEALYQWLKTEGVDQLFYYLKRYDLSNFNWQRSFDTPGRQSMIDNNQTNTEQLFWLFMDNPETPIMSFSNIVKNIESLEESDSFSNSVEEGQVRKLLQQHAKRLPPIKAEGKTQRLWQIGNLNQEYSNEELRRLLVA